MKKILCFGDSNTFGYNPKNGKRFDKKIRWTGILKEKLRNNFIIEEAGCCNRTSFSKNPEGRIFSGECIIDFLNNQTDILILAIGINDLQNIYNTTIKNFEIEFEKYVKQIKNLNSNCKIIILSPSRLNHNIKKTFFRTLFNEYSIEISEQLAPIYEKISKNTGCEFLNLDRLVKVSNYDGLHYDEEAHKIIANTLYEHLLNLT